MKYSLALAALAGIANAIVAFTNMGYDVQPGQSFELQWAGASGPVTITLKNGPKDNLGTVMVIGSGFTGTSTTVTIPSTLPPGLYAFEIKDGATTNYSPQFNFAGTGTALPSSTGAATTTGASTASITSAATTTASGSSSSSTSDSTTSSRTSRSTSASPSQTQVVNTNAAQRQGSSFALLLVSAAALYYFS